MLDGEACIRCRNRFKFEELGVAPGGFSICRECEKKLNLDEAPKRRCLADGTTMGRELVHDQILLDRCPACGGVWLDGDDVEVVKRMVGERSANEAALILIAML